MGAQKSDENRLPGLDNPQVADLARRWGEAVDAVPTAVDAYAEAIRVHGPALRDEYADFNHAVLNDGRHVWIVLSHRSGGDIDVIAWTSFDAFIGCLARMRAFGRELHSVACIVPNG